MYISRIVVRNYRNFRHLDVLLNPGATCIVGENNTGKTNLLRAIRLPVDATLSSQNRSLLSEDFSSGIDLACANEILVSLEFRDYAGKENEEAMVGTWAIGDDHARLTFRFRPRRAVAEELTSGERDDGTLSLDDYRWEIVGGGGGVDPSAIGWNDQLGKSIRFEELQQYLVVTLPPLRDVEQSLRQSRYSPLARLLESNEIPEDEKGKLIETLSRANDAIASSGAISGVSKQIDHSFAEAAGGAFRMGVELGMVSPTFNDISKNLRVLLSNNSLSRFDPGLNGLGLNNVLYVSMLLKYFEERANRGNMPGQLLLFEEPEAHLHPQLQRVLFAAFQKRNFQTVATTHSTHITSSVPLDSIVVLTDVGSPAIASCRPSASPTLNARGVADLERYLDATRGTLLYARKVMLVEGPAELFLIPPLVRSAMGVDLEQEGVSVIPIYGVHFESYAAVFGPEAISKRCAIVTDGDLTPSDSQSSREGDPTEIPNPVKPNLAALENDFVKVFAGETTFEREVTGVSTLQIFSKAAEELGATGVARELGRESSEVDLAKAKSLVLGTAVRFGKARFAQIASKHIEPDVEIPDYIRSAVDWLLK